MSEARAPAAMTVRVTTVTMALCNDNAAKSVPAQTHAQTQPKDTSG